MLSTASESEASPSPGITLVSGEQSKAIMDESVQAWAQMDGILKQIQPPVFPAHDFPITRHGAVADGKTDCTQAIRDTIEECSKAGGGRVVVPAGNYLTGPIQLKSNVDLYLAKDATIHFSTDPASYLPVVYTRFESTEVMNYSPFIYAFGQGNIAITGEGTLDGQASAAPWYHWKKSKADATELTKMGDSDVPVAQRVFGAGHELRPNFIQPYRCKNLLIEGIRIIDSPMWVITPTLCTNVTIRNVRVDTKGKTGNAPNTDGCDPDSCADVLIEDCVFNTGDDCIAIKAGRNRDGRRVNVPCQNIIIRNCKFEAGHGGITAGSETSGGIQNVFAENCSFDSKSLLMGFRFKTNPVRGGFIKDINIRNCTVKTAQFGIHLTMQYENVAVGEAVPEISNIRFQNVKFENLSQAALFVQGLSDQAKISNVIIANCTFPETKKRSEITFAENVFVVDTPGLK
jgi:polygalacturonase